MKILPSWHISFRMTPEWPVFVIPTSFRHSGMRMNEMKWTSFHIGKALEIMLTSQLNSSQPSLPKMATQTPNMVTAMVGGNMVTAVNWTEMMIMLDMMRMLVERNQGGADNWGQTNLAAPPFRTSRVSFSLSNPLNWSTMSMTRMMTRMRR